MRLNRHLNQAPKPLCASLPPAHAVSLQLFCHVLAMEAARAAQAHLSLAPMAVQAEAHFKLELIAIAWPGLKAALAKERTQY